MHNSCSETPKLRLQSLSIRIGQLYSCHCKYPHNCALIGTSIRMTRGKPYYELMDTIRVCWSIHKVRVKQAMRLVSRGQTPFHTECPCGITTHEAWFSRCVASCCSSYQPLYKCFIPLNRNNYLTVSYCTEVVSKRDMFTYMYCTSGMWRMLTENQLPQRKSPDQTIQYMCRSRMYRVS